MGRERGSFPGKICPNGVRYRPRKGSTIKAVYQSFFFMAIIAFDLGSRQVRAAEKNAFQLDHKVISAHGFKVATLTYKGATDGWIAESADCSKSAKFPAAIKQPVGFTVVLEAEKLILGLNSLFICVPGNAASVPDATPFEITRDDAVPRIAFEPQPGEFGAMPEIRLSVTPETSVAYSDTAENPAFDNDGKIAYGRKYSGPIKPTTSIARLRVRALSAAGVQSQILTAEYRENRRLKGSNSLDIYAGGVYLATLSSVRDYLPSGVGGVLGVRYGLDGVFAPSQNDINARSFWLPGAWAELQYLNFRNTPYSETAAALIAGAEWQLPLTAERSLLLTFAIGGGMAQANVNTPTYSASALTGTMHIKSGVEYHLGAWAFFLQARYAYFADQSSPLTGIGFSGGIYYKL